MDPQPAARPDGIAIIGMAGRFPGAKNLQAFWANLRDGVETITFFTDEELRAAGLPDAWLRDPCYVKAAPLLDDIEQFDAAFFDYSPREACLTDPQQRLFLECAWEALENAGYDPRSIPVPVGVYGGAGGLVSSYLLACARAGAFRTGPTGGLTHIGNDKDFLTTRLSYKLNLRGPSMTIQSACSTSLVAVHVACQSLVAHECDMALAGGVCVRVPHRVGYRHEEGGIVSPDGHCRAFDAAARGTIFGSGVGLVVLKRLADALADGDPIRAVLRGWAVNNDGGAKLSYTAASELGQARAMAEALALADFDPATLGLIEAHGTATALGDPVEVAALTKVFRSQTAQTGFCALGSVKSNIGHAEAAAGIAGLIKAVLALEQRALPPSLHFEKPNPRINFAGSPFFVNTRLRDWPAQKGPRRAGVNSLGIGGTNAFVVLEEAPPRPRREGKRAPAEEVFCLSARSDRALGELVERYLSHFAHCPDLALAEVCWTTQVGRSAFAERLAVVADSRTELQQKLLAFTRGHSLPGVFRGRCAETTVLSPADDAAPEALAKHWVQGADVAWRTRRSDPLPCRAALPTYPFERQRYWLAAADRIAELSVADSAATPPENFLGRRLPSPLQEVQFASTIGVPSWPLLGDHRVFDHITVPGAWYLAAVLAGARELHGAGFVILADVLFPQALILEEREVRPLQIVFTPASRESKEKAQAGTVRTQQHWFQVWSQRLEGSDPQASWRLHAQGRLLLGQAEELDRSLGSATPEAVEKRCRHAVDGTTFYAELGQRQITLGPTFRWHTRVLRSDTETLSRMEPPGSEAERFLLHPGLIDGCFQLLIAMLPPTYVPLSIDQLRARLPAEPSAWCYARFRSPDERSQEVASADVALLDARGNPVLEMAGVRCKRAERGSLLGEEASQRVEDFFYELKWVESPRALAPTSAAKEVGTWLILADGGGVGEAVRRLLAERGQECVLVPPPAEVHGNGPAVETQLHDVLHQVVDRRNWRGILHLWALDCAENAALDQATFEAARALGCASVLCLLQELDRIRPAACPSLWLVTRGAQTVGTDPHAPAVAQAPLWGLGRVLAAEDEARTCRLVDLDPTRPAEAAQMLREELLAGDGETQIAYRDGQRWAARLLRRQEKNMPAFPAGQPLQLQIATRGVLDNLQIQPVPRRAPAAGEVEIRVRAAGLNFRDVLNALGTYPGEAGALGLECAGEITALGAGVNNFQVGDAVLAVAFGSFRSFVTTPAALVHHRPKAWSDAVAATIPVAFLTAQYTLAHLAPLRPGQRILIHAASGGVGLAAVQLARARGAEVFATAGSPEKRAFLQTLGIEHVLNSRSVEFADEIRARTGGEGVDVVLNSLSGERLRAGLSIVRPGGHFLELGKIDIWDAQRVAAYRPEITYSTVALDTLFREQPRLVGALLREVMDGFAAGPFRPLPHQCFALTGAVRAFRLLAQAKHMGKLVLTLPAEIRPDGTYLITGGLGGLGLCVAQWLAKEGAKHLLLVGRSAPSAGAKMVLAKLEESGVQVRVEQVDVAQQEAVSHLLTNAAATLPPLRGVFHAAGILDDGVLLQQNAQRLARVMAPKVEGAWHLHTLTRDLPLDFFVLFSSMASLLGPAGQGNYAAANAFLDALAHLRRSEQRPAVSINWGPWAQVGLAASLGPAGAQRFAARGIASLAPEQGVQALAHILHEEPVQVAVLAIDWRRYLEPFAVGREPALLSALARQRRDLPRDGETSSTLSQPAAPPSALPPRDDLRQQVQQQAARVLGLDGSSALECDRPLTELGLDSLMAIELINALGKATGQRLPTDVVFNYPTITALTAYLEEQRTRPKDVPSSPLLVPVQTRGSRPPFFCVHGLGGETFFLHSFRDHLAPDQPLYGLRARGLKDDEEPDTDLRAMAARYVDVIRTVAPRGPYFLGGFCFGGSVAFEMSQQLRAQGEPVALLAILDHIPQQVAVASVAWRQRLGPFVQDLLYWIVDDLLKTDPRHFWRRSRSKLRRLYKGLRGSRGPTVDGLEAVDLADVIELPEVPDRYFRLFQVHYRAWLEYRPQPYAGEVQLIRSRTSGLLRSYARDFGWSALAAHVNVHIIPSTHRRILKEPEIGLLAQTLGVCLEHAQQCAADGKHL